MIIKKIFFCLVFVACSIQITALDFDKKQEQILFELYKEDIELMGNSRASSHFRKLSYVLIGAALVAAFPDKSMRLVGVTSGFVLVCGLLKLRSKRAQEAKL